MLLTRYSVFTIRWSNEQ